MAFPPLDDAAIAVACGHETYRRGLEYARAGHVRQVTWSDSGNTLTALVQGNRPHPYVVHVSTTQTESGEELLVGHCTCPMSFMCKHVAAALIVGREGGSAAHPMPSSGSSWRRTLRAIAAPEVDLGYEPIALQLSVQQPGRGHDYGAGRARHRLNARPMMLGAKGRWVHSNISWQRLRYLRGNANPEHLRIASRLQSLHPSSSFSYYGASAQWLDVAEIDGLALWSVLLEARRAQMPFILDDKAQSAVTFIDGPAEVAFDIIRSRSWLIATPELWCGEDLMSFMSLDLIGQPAHAAFAWLTDATTGKTQELTLLSLAAPLGDDLGDLLVQEAAIEIPVAEEAEFLIEGYPALARQFRILSQDGSFTPPEPAVPTLHLSIRHHPVPANASWDQKVIGPVIDLQWSWTYAPAGAAGLGASSPGLVDPTPEIVFLAAEAANPHAGQFYPLRASAAGNAAVRDLNAEEAILDELAWLLEVQPGLALPGWQGLAGQARLHGRAMLDFLERDLVRLQELGSVVIIEDAVRYAEAVSEPRVDVHLEPRPDSWDWFDLQVAVSVAGEEIPFELLFRALATDAPLLFLPSGRYLRLDAEDPEHVERLQRLRGLIEEARELRESARDSLGISRYQVDLWEDLVELGVVDEQSASWQQAISRLPLAQAHEPQALPAGAILAEPRPYQQEGFAWLSFLRSHGLGGILADDMGLGKTLQAIMAMAQGRQSGDAPYLVVAPTSVMGNWARECARFAPGLATVQLTETAKRRGKQIAESVAGADVVITSYALFRLDFDEFESLDWSGLWLDEAQFVKNRQSQAHGCARRLRTPFKVAITGTPLENNLMELWSLLSITAPGLFPSPDRFADYYQRPIEREQDADRLAQLRRRIRPFMLRRTKEEVAGDLPPKQEQVLELDLHPKHQKVYQRHLQRERQKVLGLIGDLRKHRFEIFKSLTMLRQLSLDASLVDEEYASIPSTKLDALVEMLGDIVSEGHRTLVFSQFTGYLAKVRTRLSDAGIATAYLDGRTRKRQEAIDAFVDGDAPVFLISLKAGGFGLNLTAADYVILLDPWWNPATEAQAIDRTHRIGQDKKVMVYRMVARDTIEERVMALKEHKAALFDAVMTGTSAGGSGLTAQEIRELLA